MIESSWVSTEDNWLFRISLFLLRQECVRYQHCTTGEAEREWNHDNPPLRTFRKRGGWLYISCVNFHGYAAHDCVQRNDYPELVLLAD